MRRSILIVDDQPKLSAGLKGILVREPGLNADIVVLEDNTIECLKKHIDQQNKKAAPVAVIITDYAMGRGENGLGIAKTSKILKPDSYVILRTTWGDSSSLPASTAADKIHGKHCPLQDLLSSIKEGLQRSRQSAIIARS